MNDKTGGTLANWCHASLHAPRRGMRRTCGTRGLSATTADDCTLIDCTLCFTCCACAVCTDDSSERNKMFSIGTNRQ